MTASHTLITSGNIEIPYTTWRAQRPQAAMIFIHGLKSHSAWFSDSGLALAEKGIQTYAFDRRGSGVSKAARGDIPNFRAWIDDIDAIVREAQSQHPDLPIHLLGHCFGAKLALAYGALHQDKLRSLCLIAPPQQALKVDIKFSEKIKVGLALISGQNWAVRVPIDDDMFTDDPKYCEFIKKDPLKLTQMTTRFCIQILRLDRWLKKNLKSLKLPILCLLAKHDDIVDQDRFQRHFFNQLNTSTKKLEIYDCRHHLLYEPHRLEVLDRIERWICRGD